jgi:hypothetical protein
MIDPDPELSRRGSILGWGGLASKNRWFSPFAGSSIGGVLILFGFLIPL